VGGALVAGFGLGFLVAAGVGPIWLLCVRTTLRHGFRPGVAIGLGAATIDTVYAALGVAGATALLRIDALRVGLAIVGSGVLAALAARTLWSAFRVRLGGEAEEEVTTAGRADATSVAATASNPLTIASWGAIFSAASVAGLAPAGLLVGIGIGSAAWFALLSGVVAVARRHVGPRVVRAVDACSAVGLLAFAGALAWHAARD
jgi:threonine/homoserine/homoserine lactone efflux protein